MPNRDTKKKKKKNDGHFNTHDATRMSKNILSLGGAFDSRESSARVGYLNAILAQGGGNLNKSIFKSSNAWGITRGGGMLMFRSDRRISKPKINTARIVVTE